MTANLSMSVGNTLILAFFVVCAIGVVAGIYGARALKKAEKRTLEAEQRADAAEKRAGEAEAALAARG